MPVELPQTWLDSTAWTVTLTESFRSGHAQAARAIVAEQQSQKRGRSLSIAGWLGVIC
jgi:hypothetical protein